MGGRRAKYKQGPPVPLPDADTRPSPKKLGKRKAIVDEDVNSDEPTLLRAAKRTKEVKKPAIELDRSSDTSREASPDTDASTSKPNQLWSSSDEESGEEDEHITMGNMEKLSRALDAEAAHEAELDLEEMQNAALAGEDHDDEREEEKKGVSDVQVVQRRMRHCVRVLRNFKKLAEKDRSRSEYVEQLLADIASYYGYNDFLANKLFQLFPVAEAIEFFEANEAQVLINRGVNLEPIGKWTNVGLQVFESSVPIGATPEYLAGHYMLQAASSFLPVIALAPQLNERVLDMASAPGGKTTHIAALLRNTGHVFANDANKARTKSLAANIHRMGCKNVTVCSVRRAGVSKVMGGFDRVLLDAPCSGTGVISKDSSVKINKVTSVVSFNKCCSKLHPSLSTDFQLLAHLQKQLILCAIDSTSPESKSGGYLVYSTCSVAVDENEAVVDYALRKRPNVKLVDTSLEFGCEGFTKYRGKIFNPSLRLTRRFYPHVHNMDGFFVAKFKVQKRSKVQTGGKIAAEPDVKLPATEEDVAFDSEEDRPFIEGSRPQLTFAFLAIMSTEATVAAVPEEVKVAETTVTEPVPTTEAPAVDEVAPATQPAPTETAAEATTAPVEPVTEAAPAEPAKEEAKTDAAAEVPKKEERPRSPGSILSKLLAPFKETRKQVEKRVKAPKSPKKEKQKDEVEPAAPAEAAPAEAKAEEPAKVEEAPAVEEPPAAEAVKETETAPAVDETPAPVEPAAESAPAETAAAEAPKEEKVDEKKEKDVKAMKVSRRISARVTEFFKAKKAEVNAPAKVDENPPVIDQPTPLPPLEHPATDATAAATTEQPAESSEPAPAAAPVIAATA
ncbi:NOL1/NOP2/sun family-domain-containing protein [Boletus reticuloceps]|uniref:NOL1/NOP2/sun family-domain-containing protein n=1 Tax=Boletus reticuloceps TaxID=495285 RepID=A0A8I3AAP6_9AGAM|nr:NOL1/NOP2/sun family-domain-containing protein [Boletus reticuloceps]